MASEAVASWVQQIIGDTERSVGPGKQKLVEELSLAYIQIGLDAEAAQMQAEEEFRIAFAPKLIELGLDEQQARQKLTEMWWHVFGARINALIEASEAARRARSA